MSADWLAHHIDAVEIRILFTSLGYSEFNISEEKDWASKHIPYSTYFDIAGLIPGQNGELVDPDRFADKVMDSGVGNGNKVIIYDTTDGSNACLIWWLFRYHGHNNVAVLDGGMGKWLSSGKEISDRPRRPKRHNFTTVLQDKMFVDDRYLEKVSCKADVRVLNTEETDVGGEFLRKSMVQSSKQERYEDRLLEPKELYQLCSNLKIDLNAHIIITGDEMIAKAKLAFLLHLLGAENLTLHLS